MLPEIVYNIKKKLGCIFVKNHNSESTILKRGHTIGIVTSWVVTQEEKGQTLVEHSDAKQSVTGTSNDTDTHIGVGNTERAGSVKSVEKLYETKDEKRQSICEIKCR